MSIRLGQIAHARSGDKGSSVNVGVIAYTAAGYELLKQKLTAAAVEAFFRARGVASVTRYELPNLLALNFILHNILHPGGSLSLRTDAQGKALGQALLEMELALSPDELARCLPLTHPPEGAPDAP
jgi:hypothetical protein